jgi:hypothetical protein
LQGFRITEDAFNLNLAYSDCFAPNFDSFTDYSFQLIRFHIRIEVC